MASFTGVANAAPTQTSVTGCSVGAQSLLVAGVFPTCTADNSTVVAPTSLTVSVDPSFLAELTTLTLTSGLLGTGGVLNTLLGTPAYNGLVGETVTYKLTCTVNGQKVTTGTQTFNATVGNTSQVIDLQSAVGSPEPQDCTVKNLTATSTLDLATSLLGPLKVVLAQTPLAALGRALAGSNLGASVTATTAVPGAIYTQVGHGNSPSYVCMDQAANGNAGSKVQAYRCNSDLAQFWTYLAGGQLVHNGDCADVNNGNVTLAACDGSQAQQWTVNGANAHLGTIVNKATNDCLTAPSTADFTQLTVANCTSADNQEWVAPAQTAAAPTATVNT
jgi:hypothetical protein